MPITFEEMVQAVINTVREREQAMQAAVNEKARADGAERKIKELEGEIEKLKNPVREPDKKPILQSIPPKEGK